MGSDSGMELEMDLIGARIGAHSVGAAAKETRAKDEVKRRIRYM